MEQERRGITFRHVWHLVIPAVALTAGYTWTVGQGGFQSTNKNLCDLWEHLPLPTYQACEFQYALVAVWIVVILVFVAWLFVSASRLIMRLPNRRIRLLGLWILAASCAMGLIISLSFAISQQRKPIESASVIPPSPAPIASAPNAAPAWVFSNGSNLHIAPGAGIIARGNQGDGVVMNNIGNLDNQGTIEATDNKGRGVVIDNVLMLPENLIRDFYLVREQIPRLGKGAAIEVADMASQHEHQRATVVFVKPLTKAYYLKPDGTAIRVDDANWSDDPKLYSEAELRKLPAFKGLPKNTLPPRGGIAKRWLADPDKWKWIGGMEWQCAYLNNLHFQTFENGVVVGVLRPNPTDKEGYFAVIFNDGTWQSKKALTPPPPCKQPESPNAKN